MKRSLLTAAELAALRECLPRDFARLCEGVRVLDSSCSPEARVYLIDRDGGYYLKRGEKGTLENEARMTSWFHTKGLAPAVLGYDTGGAHDWLLTERARGEDCTHAQYLDDPMRLCDLLATLLRSLHETDPADCPVQDRMGAYLALAEENYRLGRYDRSHFPDSFGYRSAEEAYAVLQEGRGEMQNEVLLHGDYCLPNVMLDDWRFSALIDLGNAGVGDRHVDLFWGAWTLHFNLKTDRYRDRFFDAYGRDAIDEGRLLTVAAAEVFG